MAIHQNCHHNYKVRPIDETFYNKMQVPIPDTCPTSRQQNRYAWRNERSLTTRNCDLCQSQIVTCFNNPQTKVYCRDCWWSDKWNAKSYQRDFDFSRPFFEQYFALVKDFPHFNLFQEGNNENCQYINYGINNKNCYLTMGAYTQDTYYSWATVQCQDTMDMSMCVACSESYYCLDCTNCNRLIYSRNCTQCHDSGFLINCHNSKNCFASVNLVNKEYVFFNEQLSESDYKTKLAQITKSAENLHEIWQDINQYARHQITRYRISKNTENSTGNYLDNAKNCHNCFDIVQGAIDCAHSEFIGINSNDVYDSTYGSSGCNQVYNCIGFTNFNNCQNIVYGRYLHDCYYSQYCFNSSNLFGCIGLNQSKFCILNKQYSETEYHELVPKIIAHMKKTPLVLGQGNEWGKFFPARYSPFGYQESIAQDYFPLSQNEIINNNFNNFAKPQPTTTEIANTCQKCQASFKIIPQAKLLLEKLNLPIPTNCYECRYLDRFQYRKKRHLFEHKCQKCQKKVTSTYQPADPEVVYCESCYQETIY